MRSKHHFPVCLCLVLVATLLSSGTAVDKHHTSIKHSKHGWSTPASVKSPPPPATSTPSSPASGSSPSSSSPKGGSSPSGGASSGSGEWEWTCCRICSNPFYAYRGSSDDEGSSSGSGSVSFLEEHSHLVLQHNKYKSQGSCKNPCEVCPEYSEPKSYRDMIFDSPVWDGLDTNSDDGDGDGDGDGDPNAPAGSNGGTSSSGSGSGEPPCCEFCPTDCQNPRPPWLRHEKNGPEGKPPPGGKPHSALLQYRAKKTALSSKQRVLLGRIESALNRMNEKQQARALEGMKQKGFVSAAVSAVSGAVSALTGGSSKPSSSSSSSPPPSSNSSAPSPSPSSSPPSNSSAAGSKPGGNGTSPSRPKPPPDHDKFDDDDFDNFWADLYGFDEDMQAEELSSLGVEYDPCASQWGCCNLCSDPKHTEIRHVNYARDEEDEAVSELREAQASMNPGAAGAPPPPPGL